jgi:hypothetical protein
MFVYIPGICTPEAINGFNCPIARVHFNGSILWGVVGPQRFFGSGALYQPLVWAFLVGAIAPIIVFILGKRHKKSFWRKVNLPVLFGSLSWIPPATGLNFSVWAVVCFMFNHVIRKRAYAWWSKYTMTLSAALDSGLAFALVVVFFGFIYPGCMKDFKWWGTEVYKQVRISLYHWEYSINQHPGLRLASMSLQNTSPRTEIWKLALSPRTVLNLVC